MSEKIVQLNDEVIKGQIKELVQSTLIHFHYILFYAYCQTILVNFTIPTTFSLMVGFPQAKEHHLHPVMVIVSGVIIVQETSFSNCVIQQ